MVFSCVSGFACGPGVNTQPFVEKEIMSYVDKFNSTYNTIVNIEIKFKELDDNIAGICYYYGSESFSNYIEIDKIIFSEYSNLGKEELIFHELGHCIFDREHTVDLFYYKNSMIPKSIMYPYVFGESFFYNENSSYYYNELEKNKGK